MFRLSKMAIVTIGFVLALAMAAPVAAAPASPGACHMMRANPTGISGMRGAADIGFENMIDLVLSSLDSGCSP